MSDPAEFAQMKVVSYGLMVKAIWAAIVVTAGVTMIFARFLFVEADQITTKANVAANVKAIATETNERKADVAAIRAEIVETLATSKEDWRGRDDRMRKNHEEAMHHKDHVDVVIKGDDSTQPE